MDDIRKVTYNYVGTEREFEIFLKAIISDYLHIGVDTQMTNEVEKF